LHLVHIFERWISGQMHLRVHLIRGKLRIYGESIK